MKRIGLQAAVLAGMLGLGAGAARGQSGQHVPTIEEMLSVRNLNGVAVSPDGKYVAYRLEQTNWKENEYNTQLWLANVETGKSFQLTRGKKSVWNVGWSPDGKWISFVTSRESATIEPPAAEKKEDTKEAKKEAEKEDDGGGKPADNQIWLISPEGGEAWQLTNSNSNVGGYRWSPDGKFVAFTAEKPESKTSKDRKEKYSEFDVYEKDFGLDQLWLVDVAAAVKSQQPAKPKALTNDEKLGVDSFSWSPDGTKIAFTGLKNSLLAFRGETDIYLLDLGAGNSVKRIVALDGPDRDPMFSPDGKQIVFATALADPHYYYINTKFAVVDVATVLAKPATKPSDARNVIEKFDEDPNLYGWGADGIYFISEARVNLHVYRANPATGEVTRVTSPEAFLLNDVSLSYDFTKMATLVESATELPEVYFSKTDHYAPKKLTDVSAQVKDWKLGKPEVVQWKSTDGAEIEGVLYKPADFDASKKYPLLVMIHGGPTGVSTPSLGVPWYAYPLQPFLAKGAVVLLPNYRGSAGYGAKFRALNVRNLGVGDMWDVMSGVDAMIAKGFVDPSRMAAMGWSQGGYISAFLTTHTDRFKAISVGAGISDWTTYYVNTDITPFTIQYLHATPWNDPEIYAKTSPITTIKQAKTPTLIQQGGNDKRVPVPDSFELYRGLVDNGVTSRLILYPGFGHGINKPKSQKALMEANWDWLGFYIWGVPIPKDSPLNGKTELGN